MTRKLEIFQSLWAMEQRIPGEPERPMEENFRMIAEAGYHGACIDPAVHEIDDFLAMKPLFEEYGLKCMANVFPASVEEMPPLLELCAALDACLVNAIGQVMPLKVEDCVPVIEQWMSDARRAGLPLLFETHRDCTLNDMYYCIQLMDLVPDMRLCADLSHYVVDREMRLPLTQADHDYVQRILERSDCFQGRIANREQVQVQIDFPQHQAWVRQFREWWREGFKSWKANSGPNDTLVFLCALGQPPYAITDASQRELSDRWQEALTIRDWVKNSWDEVQSDQLD